MTDFTNIKLKINETINKNKQKYLNNKTIADIEELGDPKAKKEIKEIVLFLSLITTISLGLTFGFIFTSLFSVPSFGGVSIFGMSMLIFCILGMCSLNRIGNYFVKKAMKNKINNINNGKLNKEKITEELFSNLFWTSKINKETEIVLKMTLPYNLYLMLHSKKPSGLNYLDVSKFLENIEEYEKEVKDIEDKRISIGMDVLVTSDIKDNILVI